MEKRFPAFILAFLLAFCLSAAGLSADTRIHVKSPEQGVKAGEEFQVAVELAGNPGFSSVQFKLTYDPDSVECLNVTPGNLLDGTISASNPNHHGGAFVAATVASVIQGDGVLADMTFLARRDLDAFHFTLDDVILAVGVNNNRILFDITGADNANNAAATPTPILTPATHTPTPILTPAPTTAANTPAPVPTETASGGAADPTSAPSPTPAAESNVITIADSRFTDIAGNWAEESILRCENMGLFDGFPSGEFHPNDPISRGDFIAALWNLYRRPLVDPGQTPFTDTGRCRADTRNAIAWAFSLGYISGTTPDTFTPDGPLTRQAAMKVLFNAAGAESGLETIFTSIYDQTFQDSGLLADWAKAPVYWGVYNTIINGNTPTTLNPGGLLSGAQLAVIMLRYTERFPAGV